MINAGIDIAKNKHDIHIVNTSTGDIIVDHMTITNNLNGFNSLLSIIQQYNQNDIACEATGHYHFNICDFLSSLDYSIYVLNAHDVKLYRDYKGFHVLKNNVEFVDQY